MLNILPISENNNGKEQISTVQDYNRIQEEFIYAINNAPNIFSITQAASGGSLYYII